MRKVWSIISHYTLSILKTRIVPLFLIICIFMSMLVYRLFSLQIVDADKYQSEYIQKIQDEIMLPATRGDIYDRNGVLLAHNELTYSVTFQDVDAYKKHREKNNAVLEIVKLMDAYGERIESDIMIAVNEDGKLIFTTQTDAQKRRFIRDVYGNSLIEKMAEKGEDAYQQSAEDIFNYFRKAYYFDSWKDADGNLVELDYETQLKVMSIRFSLAHIAYTKYKSITVATNVSNETVAAVMEHSNTIKGLGVSEDSIRVYDNAEYFSHIIGYTGKASTEELEELQLEDPNYSTGDVVGKTGIEAYMELQLHGTKGSQSIYKDSQGRILEVISTEEPTVGNDVYLTIDSDMQIGIYYLLEQMIAGIIVNYLVPYDYVSDGTDKKPSIPIKDVYCALVENNVLDIQKFDEEGSSSCEQQMHAEFQNRLKTVSDIIMDELTTERPTDYKDLPESYQHYMDYVYSDMLITNLGIINGTAVDREDETFLSWKAGEISLQEFIVYAINQGWVDASKIQSDTLYSDTAHVYKQIVATVDDQMQHTTAFQKLIYEELIRNEIITGNQLCLALFEQGVLTMDQEAYDRLLRGNAETSYSFMVDKIRKLEITPAQLALDPCSGAVVVTDVKTGETLVLCSYPGYDNNMLSGSVDATYWQQLINDESTPLLCRATQTTIAPGSTYKMISTIAGLEENVVTKETDVDCTGIYTKVTPNPACWIGEPGHGMISAVGALAQSCNSYFYDIGYNLSLTKNGFNAEQGLDALAKYAAMFGLDTTSGVEMNERAPTISDVEPVASAIGQGKNSYATIQLARYVTALASKNLYDLTLINRVTDRNGNIILKRDTVIDNEIQLEDSTWDTVREGMYAVCHYGGGFVGTVSGHMSECVVDVAGKTGSAQEDKKRSEHAQFVSYAPYDDPEITVTITIPNGYASGYCAYLACEIYNYIYGDVTLEEIQKQNAYKIGGNAETSD